MDQFENLNEMTMTVKAMKMYAMSVTEMWKVSWWLLNGGDEHLKMTMMTMRMKNFWINYVVLVNMLYELFLRGLLCVEITF